MTSLLLMHAVPSIAHLPEALRRSWRHAAALSVAACAALGSSGVAVAQQVDGVDFLAPRVELAAQLARVSDTDLRRAYLRCAHASNTRRLSAGEGHACSSIADALMHKSFNGDFNALIAWWQANRHSAVAQLQR